MQQLQTVGFSQKQQLNQVLNTQMLQSIKLMELPIIDLRDRVIEELEANPALELVRDKSTVSLDATNREHKPEKDYFEGSSDSGFLHTGKTYGDSDLKRQFIEGVLTRSVTLQEHLLQQWRLHPLEKKERESGEFLIQNINSDGFNTTPLEDLFNKNSYSKKMLEYITKLIQRLDPIGCCTNNYIESLTVQAHIKYPQDADDIISLIPYMQDIERKRFSGAQKVLGISEEDIVLFFDSLKTLNPFPGRQFKTGTSGDTRYVVPDVQVLHNSEDDSEEFSIIINSEEIPVLGIEPYFLQNKKNMKKEERDYMSEKVREAQWFMECINKRNHTLFRVMRAIVLFQKNFFRKGPKYLSPLTLEDIAQEIKVHSATVSRTANSKYVQTEWGIFELRYFFTNSISGSGITRSKHSQSSVKEIIREIVNAEGKQLSDQQISKLLEARGISIARRTVAKYRSQLDLGSSYER
ncbi:MAG: RNA polymerase factor sigma-54 [Termitinemataceae bacterium]|nr:MAG: RNA polymerase factor sigma-54 [Termitinemataceae bacterium]